MPPELYTLLTLLAFACSALGQQLPRGTFFHSTGFTYTEFTFKTESKFAYKHSSCTGGEEGDGTYSFRNNQLVLSFENPAKKQLPSKPLVQRQETRDDFSHLDFTFHDQKDTSFVSGVRLLYRDSASETTLGTASNAAGHAQLKIANSHFPLEVEISYVGIRSQNLRFDASGNYTITYPLAFEFMRVATAGDTLKFTIDSYDDESIVLKQLSEKKFQTFARKD